MNFKLAAAIAVLVTSPALAVDDMAPRDGWAVHASELPYEALLENLKTTAKANGMAVVTQAGPTGAAKARGIEIPDNRVIGLFNNQFAVEILELSTAAMIEAPVRMYLTGNADGTATLSYKLPSVVFAPYIEEGGAALEDAAGRLDAIFDTIAVEATR